MRLNDPNVESQWLTVYPVGTPELPFDENIIEMVRSADAVQGMWNWLPRISGGGTSFESYCQRVMKLTNEGRFFPMIVFRKSDNELVGGASFLRPSRTHRSVEIGFVLLNEGFRNWVSFAALQEAMIRRASQWRAQRIVWSVSKTNDRMMRVMTRLGARQDGVLRSAYRMNDGSWSDTVIFSLIKDEIPDCLQRLGQELKDTF